MTIERHTRPVETRKSWQKGREMARPVRRLTGEPGPSTGRREIGIRSRAAEPEYGRAAHGRKARLLRNRRPRYEFKSTIPGTKRDQPAQRGISGVGKPLRLGNSRRSITVNAVGRAERGRIPACFMFSRVPERLDEGRVRALTKQGQDVARSTASLLLLAGERA